MFKRVLAGLFLFFQTSSADNREAGWLEDLKFLETEFGGHQKDFGKLYPRFHEEMTGLRSEVGKLRDEQITMRVMRMVASGNVGHNTVYMSSTKLHPLPLTLEWFADGLAVVAAKPEYQQAQGARVVKIGSMTPEELLTAVAPYISHENGTALRQDSPPFMQRMSFLKEVGAIATEESTVFTLQKPGGEPFEVTVKPGNPEEKRVTMFEALNLPAVLYRKQLAAYYWYEYLPESNAIYVQYNRCANDPKLPFADFAKEVLAAFDSHGVKRVVLDLRLNAGGNSRVIEPLKAGLKQRHSKVFVLIGPRTFSSAQLGAIEFRKDLHATLVGEATSEKPNSYGEVKPITLPNSGLKMQYSTKFFQLVKGDPAALEPDIRAPRSLADAYAGRDAALDAALRP